MKQENEVFFISEIDINSKINIILKQKIDEI